MRRVYRGLAAKVVEIAWAHDLSSAAPAGNALSSVVGVGTAIVEGRGFQVRPGR